MSTAEQDWQKEQQRVDHVVREIEQRMETLQAQVSDAKGEIVEIRKNFWDDVTVNFEDAAETAETYASMKQQAEVLSERERTHRQNEKQLKTLAKLHQTPYFGRIDFADQEEPQAEQIYLGIASLLDSSGEQYLIYDWRAPVSSLYYDYPPGPAKYETPGGTVEGEIELKRQFMIRDGAIRSMFDTGVTIGDELLQEVLGQQTDAQMKSIVATIQQEQNRIIRDERSQLLVVQGAAGSGKTSAALQRVAYLLYRYRGMLRSEQIVLFSPNPMFNSYVSTVLPELGEENMQQTTFQEYLENRLGKAFTLEDPFEQMEYTLSAMEEPEYEARMAGIRYKTSMDYLRLIERYVEFLKQKGLIFKPIVFRGEILISAERIAEHFYALDSSISLPNRMKLVAEELLRELKQLAKIEREKPWVEDQIELLDKEDYLDVYEKLRSKKQYTSESFDDFERERDMLATMIVQEQFKKLRKRVKLLRFIHLPAIYKQLFEDPQFADQFSDGTERSTTHWSAICAHTVSNLNQAKLAYEDATPYLFLQELLEGFQTNTSIRHVFLDEAQDYSPFQFAFMKRLFPFSRITALGDLNQTIYTHAADHSGFAPLRALFDPDTTQTYILTRTYRSTRPIVEFTSQLIQGGDLIEPFNRDGSLPTLTEITNSADLAVQVAARTKSLQGAGHQTVAIICKTAEECRTAYEELKDKIQLRLIHKESTSFEAGVLIIPSYLAKGMEFDAVIIYDASARQYGLESERKLFYTACTRAMHELHLLYCGPLSPFVAAVSPDRYTLSPGLASLQ